MSDTLTFTGERFHPDCAGEIWYEHWHRYHLIAPQLQGLTVLDVACGEGYGTHLLAHHAQSVIGVDISQPALQHAQQRYTKCDNLQFVLADCGHLPFANACFDCVVSFETIEHIDAQEAFLGEIRRVLRPDGLLLLTSPNKAEYSDKRQFSNEFHIRELYREELAELIGEFFPQVRWYGQKLDFFSLVWPLDVSAPQRSAQLLELQRAQPESPCPLSSPLYYFLVAGHSSVALAHFDAHTSVFADAEDFLYRDYAESVRGVRKLMAHIKDLEGEKERAIADFFHVRCELDKALAQQSELDRQQKTFALQVATQEAELHALQATLVEQQRLAAYRDTFTAWLRYPVRRLRQGWRSLVKAV
jgi:SAM-dependent methyltransferase